MHGTRYTPPPFIQELLELEAQEAFVRLEAYKKAGVYAVLKRIEVWQSRGGQRLGDIFQGVSEYVRRLLLLFSRPTLRTYHSSTFLFQTIRRTGKKA